MATMMLNRTETEQTVKQLFTELREAGFRFASYDGQLPAMPGPFKAWHPLSGQEVELDYWSQNPQQMTDPSRSFVLRVAVSRNFRRQALLKVWGREKVGGAMRNIGDVPLWASEHLRPLLDTADRRWGITRWIQAVLPKNRTGTYLKVLLPTC